MRGSQIEVGYGLAKGNDAFAVGRDAALQASTGIGQNSLSAVLAFASVCYDLEKLLGGIHTVVGEAPVLGTTTAGEICDGSQQNSVVVIALASPHLSVRVGVGTAVSRDWQKAVSQATSAPQMLPFFSQGSAIWSELTRQGRSAFALLFSPGNTRHADSRSYEILEELKRLSEGRLPIFGGSAADDWRMEENYVLMGQHVYPDSVLVAVFETRLCFGIALAHGLRPGPRRAVVTRSRGHEVLELDGRPAAEAYADMLGTSRKALEGKHLTLTTKRPVGSPDPYGQYSINVASYTTPQGGVRFAQPVPERTSVTIMDAERDPMIAAGQEALRKALLRSGTAAPAAVLVFSCALRSRILGERTGEEIDGIKTLVPGVPLVGFYSFGEQGLADDGVNRHNNEVIAVLVLGQELSYAAQVALENERLREELRQGESRFRGVVAQAYDGICLTDERGHVLEWNQALEEITGLKMQDVLNRPIWDVQFQMAAEEERTPEAYRQLKARLLDFLEIGVAPWANHMLEREYVRPDGRRRFVQGVVSSVKTDKGYVLVSTSRDITEPKRAQEQLRQAHDELEMRVKERTAELESANRALQRESAERGRAAEALRESEERLRLALEAYRTSVEHSLQGLAILQGGRVVFANPAMAAMTGYTVEELLSLSPQEVVATVHAEDRERVRRTFADYLVGRAVPSRQEFRHIRRDGDVRWVETLQSRITYRGVPALQISYMDTTERKQAEETVRSALQESARSRRLLLALSQAAQAVGRARTTDEVYRIVGQEISALGYQATLFTLDESRTHLVVSYLTHESALIRTAEKLTGLSAQGYRFPLAPDGLHRRVIDNQETVFTWDDEQPALDSLPRPVRPLAKRLTRLLGVEQSIVAPLMVSGKVHGLFSVSGSGLREADVPAITGFANQAAIAIENAQLLDRITGHERELQELSARLIRAQEEERGRLARELHDEIGQALTAMNINIAEVEKRLPPDLKSALRDRLAETAALVEQTSEQISTLALDLRPSLLDDLGLVSALRWYVSRYTERMGIQVQVEAVDLAERLDRETETTLYRVVQEALTNVARHARATNVRLRLERKVSSIVAIVEDNGQGFDTTELTGDTAPERGAGLLGMRERVTLLGGTFHLKSVPGGGTELSVEIPLRWRDSS